MVLLVLRFSSEYDGLLTRCDVDFFGNEDLLVTLVLALVLVLFSLFWNFMYFLCESMIEFRSLRIASPLS